MSWELSGRPGLELRTTCLVDLKAEHECSAKCRSSIAMSSDRFEKSDTVGLSVNYFDKPFSKR